eukprot:3600425-Pyramimonas_sp.AAC.1
MCAEDASSENHLLKRMRLLSVQLYHMFRPPALEFKACPPCPNKNLHRSTPWRGEGRRRSL